MARPRTFTVNSNSKASPSAVYALLVRPGTWPSWSPIDSAEIEGGGDPAGRQQIGDIRVFRIGRVVSRERITALVPDRRFAYEIEGGPFRSYHGVVQLEAASHGTDITWSASFEPKLPLSGTFWRWYLTRFLQRMANGLAEANAQTEPELSTPIRSVPALMRLFVTGAACRVPRAAY